VRPNESNADNGRKHEWPSDLHETPANGRSLTAALEHFLNASQRVITKRIDLALLELSDGVKRVVRGTLMIGVGVSIVACGWWALMAFIVFLLDGVFTLPARLAIIVGLSAAIGVVLIVVGIQDVRGKSATQLLPEHLAPDNSGLPQTDRPTSEAGA